MLAFIFRIFFLAVAVSSLAFAANAQFVRISNLSDVNTPTWIPGDPDIVQEMDICIYRANIVGASRFYSIVALGGPGFYIRNGFRLLPYHLEWSDGGANNPGGNSFRSINVNAPLTLLNNARNNRDVPVDSNDCNGGGQPTARLRVTFRTVDLEQAADGIYTGALTLIAVPQ